MITPDYTNYYIAGYAMYSVIGLAFFLKVLCNKNISAPLTFIAAILCGFGSTMIYFICVVESINEWRKR